MKSITPPMAVGETLFAGSATLRQLARSVAFLGGSTIIMLAVMGLTLGVSPQQALSWSVSTLGASYLFITGFILLVSIFALLQYQDGVGPCQRWSKIGQQANTALATIALTYTLCGISLGVGSLATTDLSPDTINNVIGHLTEQFSMAFMTSVVGLPLSALMRFIFVLNDRSHQDCHATDYQQTVNAE